jgi:NADH dehydrogenase [ubiquinone] 1 alpha subcomplex assembly factor 1
MASKGRIQDKQFPLHLSFVSHFGITLADKNDGPFRLEIDWIGLEYDPTHVEDFAYEQYKVDKYVANH